jgi:4-amino-4-deoxy-L-arabinose transferase-like glycosyltransferase
MSICDQHGTDGSSARDAESASHQPAESTFPSISSHHTALIMQLRNIGLRFTQKRAGLPLLILLPTLLMALFLWISIYGVNFGVHWDENAAKFDSVQDSIKTGLFMQAASTKDDRYVYGGLNYLLTWLGFSPEMLQFIAKGQWNQDAFSAAISPIIYSVKAKVRVRAIYIVISGLSILWLFLLNIVLGRSRLEAFLGAAIFAFSWEVGYHSRWIAPDQIMMHFVLLSFLCLAAGITSKRLLWFYLGAISMGLTIGSKYPGGLVLPFFIVGVALATWQQTRSAVAIIKRGVAIAGITFMTFVATTPGIIQDPFRFFGTLISLRAFYANGHYGYTVKPGFPHLMEILKYFSMQVFSHYWFFSVVLMAFCIVGFFSIVRGKQRMIGLLALGFVVSYLAILSQPSQLIVRNLLVVVPFLCLAAARGIAFISERLRPRIKVGLYIWIAISLIANVGWGIYAARQIKQREHLEVFLKKFEDYARNSPTDTFLISAKLSTALQSLGDPFPRNIVMDSKVPYTKVAFFQTEGPDRFWPVWPANSWNLYERTFGALEVNLGIYTTFIGNQRILLLTARHYGRLPIKVEDMNNP